MVSGSHRSVADMVIIAAKLPPLELMALMVERCIDQSFLLRVAVSASDPCYQSSILRSIDLGG